MKIVIPPLAIGLMIIILGNFLLGFGKSNVMKKVYMIVSSVLSALGLVGMAIIRPMLISKLNVNFINGRLDAGFVTWATRKFDYFAVISITISCLTALILLCLLFIKRKNSDTFKLGNTVSFVVNALRVIIFLFMFFYSYNTINKRFDLASYIMLLSISEILFLYIPLVARRVMIFKK